MPAVVTINRPDVIALIEQAAELRCPPVSYDERITRFAERYGRQYGFAVAA